MAAIVGQAACNGRHALPPTASAALHGL